MPQDARATSGEEGKEEGAAPAKKALPLVPSPPLAEPVKKGLFGDNPVLVQVLGVCSALAVTNRMDKTLAMCGALVFVTAFSCLGISLLRDFIPRRVRMITFMLIISSFVIVVEPWSPQEVSTLPPELSLRIFQSFSVPAVASTS